MRMRHLISLAMVAGVALTGCSSTSHKSTGTGSTSTSPKDRLVAAKTYMDNSKAIWIKLQSSNFPQGKSGILSATGAGNNSPAFKGTLSVQASGISADVPVVSTGGKVWAKLPFTTSMKVINPADYNAPDPAQLFSKDNGLSSLLPQTQNPTLGSKQRSGSDVVQTIDGTLPGSAIKNVLKLGDTSGTFKVSYGVLDNNETRTITMTGPFYTGSTMTYTVELTNYGKAIDIQAP